MTALRIGLRSLTAVALFVAMSLGLIGQVNAFKDKVTYVHPQYYWGKGRVVGLDGTYQLAQYEQLQGVYIVTYDVHGNLCSTAQGTFDAHTGTWSCAVGDFACSQYQVMFHVSYGTQHYVYFTSMYPWTGH